MINKLLKSISALTRANLLTGFWDGKRNEMRKAYDDLTFIDPVIKEVFKVNHGNSNEMIYYQANKYDGHNFTKKFMKTERESRKNCELRAVERKKIDDLFEKIIKEKF